MSKIFSFASWNVEHFGNDPARIERAIAFLANADPNGGGPPDIFAIYEVEGRQVFRALVNHFPSHSFFITEADISQNILVGFRCGMRCFVTQREDLTAGVPTLRPGALATLMLDDEIYSLLFLHMKADDQPRSWGLRDNMTMHIQGLKRKLDSITPGDADANFMVLGDFNNVGMNLTFSERDFKGDEELARYSDRFKKRRLRLLPKTSEFTFSNGSQSSTQPANLDHVYAARHLNFRQFDGNAEVLVKGWPEFGTVAEQDSFIADYSDHALLYGEVHTP